MARSLSGDDGCNQKHFVERKHGLSFEEVKGHSSTKRSLEGAGRQCDQNGTAVNEFKSLEIVPEITTSGSSPLGSSDVGTASSVNPQSGTVLQECVAIDLEADFSDAVGVENSGSCTLKVKPLDAEASGASLPPTDLPTDKVQVINEVARPKTS